MQKNRPFIAGRNAVESLLRNERDNQSYCRQYHSYEPKTHDDGFFAPTERFEVVVERGDAEYLFSVPEFFRSDLDNDGEDFQNVDSRDYEQNEQSVRNKRDDREVRSEREGSHVAHVELRRLDIEPKEGDEPADDEQTEGGKNEQAAVVTDERVNGVIHQEYSSREPVEPVGNVHGVRHGDDDEHEERQVQVSDGNRSEHRDVEPRPSEFEVEPIRPDGSENEEKNHLYPSGKPLRSADSANVQIIVHDSYRSDGGERKEREIGFVAVPEGEAEGDAEILFQNRSEVHGHHGGYDENRYREQDDASSHSGRTRLVLMELREFGSLSYERFFANRLAELVFPKETDVGRNEEKRQQKSDDQVGEEGGEMVHVRKKVAVSICRLFLLQGARR